MRQIFENKWKIIYKGTDRLRLRENYEIKFWVTGFHILTGIVCSGYYSELWSSIEMWNLRSICEKQMTMSTWEVSWLFRRIFLYVNIQLLWRSNKITNTQRKSIRLINSREWWITRPLISSKSVCQFYPFVFVIQGNCIIFLPLWCFYVW